MMPRDERIGELVRLLERDYDQTGEFIRSVVGSISITRGWAVTVWLALLGIGIQQTNAAFAVLASAVLVPFGLLDGYYSWLYSQALHHARALESLTADYYGAIEHGDDDEELVLDFEARLGAHRFGLYSHLRRFSLPELRSARPRLVFQAFYPGLILGGIGAATLILVFG